MTGVASVGLRIMANIAFSQNVSGIVSMRGYSKIGIAPRFPRADVLHSSPSD